MAQNVKRNPPNKRGKPTLLIVCEGQKTEPNYFRALKQEQGIADMFQITVKAAHGFTQVDVVRDTIKFMKTSRIAYDKVWCVLDVEGPEKRETLLSAIKLAKQHKITLCLSNPAFEVWLIAHFERKATPYTDGNAAKAALDKLWAKHFGQKYEEGLEDVFERLKPFLSTAIVYAEWVLTSAHQRESSYDANSSTEVFRLVKMLTDTLPEPVAVRASWDAVANRAVIEWNPSRHVQLKHYEIRIKVDDVETTLVHSDKNQTTYFYDFASLNTDSHALLLVYVVTETDCECGSKSVKIEDGKCSTV